MNAKNVLASKGITERPRRANESENHPKRRNEGKFIQSQQNEQ